MLSECPSRRNPICFENTRCEMCGHRLSSIAPDAALSALDPAAAANPNADAWTPLADPKTVVRFCDNGRHDLSNWLV